MISQVDRLYQLAAAGNVQYRLVEHDLFERFSALSRRFRRELRDAEVVDDEHWTDFLWTLQRYRVDHSIAPLPFDDESVAERLNARELKSWAAQSRSAYPEFYTRTSELIELLGELRSCPDNPLLDQLSTLEVGARGSKALFVRDSRLFLRVQAVIERRFGRGRIAPVGIPDLRSPIARELLYVLGPVSWTPEFVFSAPRAALIQVISFRWQRERWTSRPAFRGGRSAARSVGSGREVPESVPEAEREDPWPEIDWSSVERSANRTLPTDADADANDLISARLILLDGGYGVFLDADDGSTVLTLDVSRTFASRVERVPLRAIEPGMFVLLRTEGGGDYIIPIADQILGPDAEPLRTAQKEWKGLLRQRVRRRGLAAVCADLIENGSQRADEQNVRNWMSLRSIRTQDKADFDAIMVLVGLRLQADNYWKKMGRIRAAHRAAGFEIRRRLLEQVGLAAAGDLSKGRIDFELPGVDGGRLSAFRVEDIAATLRSVPSFQLGRPFILEG
jgi:hypothetical protein